MVWKSSTRLFRPVTGGADQEEEENVDREGVQDSHNGALRDGNARGLQLACGRAGRKDTWRCVLTHDEQKIDSEFKEKSNKNIQVQYIVRTHSYVVMSIVDETSTDQFSWNILVNPWLPGISWEKKLFRGYY